MQDRSKFLLYSSAVLFFGAIFVLSCILQAEILTPIISKAASQSKEQSNDVVQSWRLEEKREREIDKVSSNGSKIVCYLTLPGAGNSAKYLNPSEVDPNVCTHILAGFASVVNCSLYLGEDIQFYKAAINLKAKNPALKVMITVGGMNEISSGFPEMTRNHTNRKKFIKSVLTVIKTLQLDGLDIDWEFPAWMNVEERQKIHFVQLLYELKKAFSKTQQRLILSAAVGASIAIIDQCYYVPNIAEHVDFVNLMTYDYHFYSSYLPMTGLNAPLFPNPEDNGIWRTMNVNYSANYWVEKGMPREKLVVGIPTYGHSFTLDNPDNHGLSAPCNGYGSLGLEGFVSYPTVCSFLKNGTTEVFLNGSRVSYAFHGTEWISYDDVNSVIEKAKWLCSAGFGGAMIFSLNADDWNATCDRTTSFPLTRAIRKVIVERN